MELLNKSKELFRFLECIVGENIEERLFFEQYEALVIPSGRSTPFSDIVGIKSNSTVIFHKKKHTNHSILREDIGMSALDGLDLTSLEKKEFSTSDTSILQQAEVNGNSRNFASTTSQLVNIGQPLKSKLLYLSSTSHLHEHKSWHCPVAETLSPVSLSSARFLLSLFSLGVKSSAKPLPDIWAVCEKNPSRIVALGCSRESPSSAMHVIAVKEEDGQSQEILDCDRKYCGGFSEYEITTAESADREESFLEKITIRFTWNDVGISVLAPPPENSDALLTVCSTPGHLFSPILSIFEELKSLYYLCQVHSGKAKWVAFDEEDVVASTNKWSLSVKGFLEDASCPLPTSMDVTVVSPPCSHTIYESRSNLDFVERLWTYCHSVTSYEELKLVFAEVFKAVILGQLQPFIHRKSTSTLAGLLREVLIHRDRETIQDLAVKLQLLLSEARLVPCLIQIGLEKLKSDYFAFFSGADLLSSDYFEHFFGPKDNTSYLDQCMQLCKLHTVAELNASLMKTLKLPTPVLSGFTKSVMEFYKKDVSYQPFVRSPTFSLSLPAYSQALKSVVALCSKLSPDTWKICAQPLCSLTGGPLPRRMLVKKTRPLLGYLQTLDSSNPYYSYEASGELVPLN